MEGSSPNSYTSSLPPRLLGSSAPQIKLQQQTVGNLERTSNTAVTRSVSLPAADLPGSFDTTSVQIAPPLLGVGNNLQTKAVVTQGYLSPLSGSSSSSRLGRLALQAESDDEKDVCVQLSSTAYPGTPQVRIVQPMGQLPGGGRLDDLLLRQGSSHQLLLQMVEEFREDPAVDWGAKPTLVGQFHSKHGGTYPLQIFSPRAVKEMLSLGEGWWRRHPNVLRLQINEGQRLIVVGDTHGQLNDVIWMFFKYGVPSSSNPYLFVGDIVDRGGHSLEILLLLFAFKRDDPGSVYILRGNHEDASIGSLYGLKAELESKFGVGNFGGKLFCHLTEEVLPLLPLAALISDRDKTWSSFVAHGGLPSGGFAVDQIERLNRFVPTTVLSMTRGTAEDRMLFNLLWADPIEGSRPVQGSPSAQGRGEPFFEEDTLNFCQAENVAYVIRAHQPPKDLRGFSLHHLNRCITVFSASNYGLLGNKGGVLMLSCDKSARAGFPGFKVSEHSAPAWRQLAEAFDRHDVFAMDSDTRLQASASIEATRLCPGTPTGSPSSSPTGSPSGSQTMAATVPAKAVPVAKPKVTSAALMQWEHHVIDQICRFKRNLFLSFSSADPEVCGRVPLSTWKQVMALVLGIKEGLDDLAEKWKLGQQVEYVVFLHRFQITAENPSNQTSTHVDIMKKMSSLHLQLSDVHIDLFVQGLDKDLNGKVSLSEFSEFLSRQMVEIPLWQTAALYEALFICLDGSVEVEDVCEAIALITVDTSAKRSPETLSNDAAAAAQTAAAIGAELRKKAPLLQTFRRWDTDGNGYITGDELHQALIEELPDIGTRLSQEQFRLLMQHIDGQGVANGRISLIEFLRAVGRQKVKKELQYSLLGEVLKPVYLRRQMLMSYLSSYDPSSNVVAVHQFMSALTEMNRQLSTSGDMLSESQMHAVCEIAACGTKNVEYRSFLNSLCTSDTLQQSAKSIVYRL
eukprot:TRINITY_DN2973_c0_g4_i1.p1 TRINITY_DN2973_c0_g4~~TRINITY_DN2973_c0_g4_i1.p1  ORF type:complete len:971 (-),score=182.24 TRINITY_DN2973_c0_g4_i1:321-3206(-)